MKRKIAEVIALVEKTYPGLGETARMVLAGAATTRLERQHPLSIILIGGTSSGKTTLLIPLTRGVKDSAQRPGLKRLMTLVRARKVEVVVVTKLDRFARSLKHLISALDEFTALGVVFVSVGDQIDLTTASGRLMLHLG